MILDLLKENQLAHRTVPLGYSFTIDSKQEWLRWEKMSLKHNSSQLQTHITEGNIHMQLVH